MPVREKVEGAIRKGALTRKEEKGLEWQFLRLRLQNRFIDQIDKERRVKGITRTQFIRDAIENYIKTLEKL